MEKYIISTILVTLFFFCKHAVANEAGPTTKHYVVYMGEHSSLYSDSVISSNHELLASVAGSISQAEEATTHHYYKSFRGFSAFLTPKQAQKLRETESVISVFENKSAKLHTTHSWEFLGIDTIPQNNEQTKMDPKADVIVGVFDTGVWPESQSFSDDGLGPVPERFKGTCGDQADAPLFPCNKKIIGARFYPKTYDDLVNSGEVNPLRAEFRSPLDHNGHGTHTASTIAGSVVNNVSYFGMASGTARGGIPNARLAIYKVCWPLPVGCPYADILSAFDDAIQDGVDIISMSIGIAPSNSLKLLSDPFTIGSIHAFTNNILLSASGGNDGKSSSVSHIAPWTLTVAASTINRELNSNVQLGNNVTLKGSAINSLQMDKYYGIIDATAAASDVNQVERAKYCLEKSLDANLIREKIVVCTAETKDFIMENRLTKGVVVNNGGGVGMILFDPFIGNELGIENVIPTTVLGSKEIEFLQEYLRTEKIPTAIIHPTETVISDTIPAPDMAFFSSKGPNIVATDIIKPDITAPGVNILASKPPPSREGAAIYKFDSGTSMSCPHVSAVAAIIKSHHPSWSSSAIKSAIMTTAYAMHKTGGERILKNLKGSSTTPFDYGSGHINPAAALDPGLIYEYGTHDMINFICSSTNQTKIPLLEANCPDTPVPTYDLNYPSIGVATMDGSVTVNRTVTYYGEGPAIFDSEVILDNPNVKFIVTPKQLEFKEAGENISFSVKFMADSTSPGSLVFGSLTWSFGNKYKVTSPIGLNLASAIVSID